MELLFLLYMIGGYWATGQTIYRNKIMIGRLGDMFMTRLIWGTLAGFILIPWAVLSIVLRGR